MRQLLSIVLSIFFFGHEINAMEALGVSIVFVALGVQIVSKYQAKYRKKPTPKASPEVRRDAEMPPRCRGDALEVSMCALSPSRWACLRVSYRSSRSSSTRRRCSHCCREPPHPPPRGCEDCR